MSSKPGGTTRLVVGITGASGVIYGIRMLEILEKLPIETHLVMSRAAELTIGYETDRKPSEIRSLADFSYPIADVAAPISSGSFKTVRVGIPPRSMRSLAGIPTGVTPPRPARAARDRLQDRPPL